MDRREEGHHLLSIFFCWGQWQLLLPHNQDPLLGGKRLGDGPGGSGMVVVANVVCLQYNQPLGWVCLQGSLQLIMKNPQQPHTKHKTWFSTSHTADISKDTSRFLVSTMPKHGKKVQFLPGAGKQEERQSLGFLKAEMITTQISLSPHILPAPQMARRHGTGPSWMNVGCRQVCMEGGNSKVVCFPFLVSSFLAFVLYKELLSIFI